MNPTSSCLTVSSGPRLLRRPASEALEQVSAKRRKLAAPKIGSYDYDCWATDSLNKATTMASGSCEEEFPSIAWDFDEEFQMGFSVEGAAVLSQSLFNVETKTDRRKDPKGRNVIARSKALSSLVEAEAAVLVGQKPDANSMPYFLVG
jgi:hypothetical protein